MLPMTFFAIESDRIGFAEMTIAEVEVDDFLAHYGVKGMRWGVRKADDSDSGSSTRKGLTEGQKKALKVGAGVAAITGAAVVTGILAKNGKLPVAQLSRGVQAASNARAAARLASSPHVFRGKVADAGQGARNVAAKARSAANTASDAREGAKIARDMGMQEARRLFDKVDMDMTVKDFEEMIAQAHRDETKYMKTQSSRSGISYDPGRDNRYSPEARLLRQDGPNGSIYDQRLKRAGISDDYMKKYGLR